MASLQAALRFYRDLLGLRVTDEGEDSGPELDAITGLSGVRMRYAELDLGGGQLLELIEFDPPAGTPLSQRPRDSGASHLALRVDDVDALCARLLAAGVTVPGRPTTITAPGRLARRALRLRARIPTAAPSSLSSGPLDIARRAAETPMSGRESGALRGLFIP